MEISQPWIISLVAALTTLCVYLVIRLFIANHRLKSERRGIDVKRGFVFEQILPLAKSYPWDPGNFKFLGNPIDGIHFEEDEIVLVEFKSGKSQLSERQKHLRDVVKSGRVSFKEVRATIKNGAFEGIEIK